MQKADNKTQTLIAILLGVAGLLILLIFLIIRSQADDTTPTASIDDVQPTIETIRLGTTVGGNEVLTASPTSSLNLTENTTTTLSLNGTVQDFNGCEDITAAEDPLIAVIATNDTVHTVAVADPTSSYGLLESTGGCSLTGCTGASDLDVDYECTFGIEHFAANTTTDTPKGTGEALYWVAKVIVQDVDGNGTGNAAPSSTASFEMNLLTAIDVGSSINYGSVSFDTTSTEVALTVTNTGNDNTTDFDIIGTAMTCTTGTIAVGQQRYDTSAATYGTALTAASTTPLDANLAKQTATTTQSTSSIYWDLFVPTPTSTSVAGTCTGTTTLYGTAY